MVLRLGEGHMPWSFFLSESQLKTTVYFVKKNQNILEFFLTFFAHFSMSKKTQDVLGGFSLIFKSIFQFCKEDPGYLRRFFKTFLAHFSVSKKTQDVLGGFVPIFSPFFNSVNKTQDV